MRKLYVHIFFIIVTGILVYSNTLNAPFIWDDNDLILNNVNIRSLSNFTDASGTRYLTFLTFALNYKINGYNTAGYHIFNICLHIINALLVYWLVALIFRAPYLKASGSSPAAAAMTAFLSGLLFVSHPVYTQAVTYISQRSILLATFFCLLSITMYLEFRTKDEGGSKKRKMRYILYSGSLISAVLAMKCKETAFILPLIIVLFDRFFFGRKSSSRSAAVYLVPILLTMLIIPLSKPQPDVFNPSDPSRFKIQDENVISGLDAKKLSGIPRADYMLTELRVIVTYLRLFFFPKNLNLDYDYPVYRSFSNPDLILSFLFLIILLASAIYIYRITGHSASDFKVSAPGLRLVSLGIFWFFISLSIESFVVILNYVIFEYRLYLPSIGIILSLAGIMSSLSAYSKERLRYISIPVILVVIAFSAATYARNSTFRDEVGLWNDVIKKSTQNSRAYFQLGFAHAKRGNISAAIDSYRASLRLSPGSAAVHYHLGMLYAEMQQLDLAVREFRLAVESAPNYSEAHNGLGNAYYIMGNFNNAIYEYTAALQSSPENAEAHSNLGDIYMQTGMIDRAIEHYRQALKINPSLEQARKRLANAERLMENPR